MTNSPITTNNHPAHCPVSLDRLHQIREHLLHDTQYSNGGNRAYILADMLRVIEGAIAAFVAEPVFFIEVDGEDWIQAGRIPGSTFDFNNLPDGVNKLWATPQPAPIVPTVTFYRDGIEAAATWVDQQRESYDSEHGRHDPDTGMFEFGGDAQRDYSATLEEIAEGIRGLHPNTAPPAPVVPDEKPMPEASKMHAIDAVAAIAEVRGWNACRAAMLKAAPKQENI